MWKTLGSLRETVKEGFQEFSRDALRETTLIRSSVVENVVPVTKTLANAGRRFSGRKNSTSYEEEGSSADEHATEGPREPASGSPSGQNQSLGVSVDEDESRQGGDGWEGQLTPVIALTADEEEEEEEGWEVDDAPLHIPDIPATIESSQWGRSPGAAGESGGTSSDSAKAAGEVGLPEDRANEGRPGGRDLSSERKSISESQSDGSGLDTMHSISLEDDEKLESGHARTNLSLGVAEGSEAVHPIAALQDADADPRVEIVSAAEGGRSGDQLAEMVITKALEMAPPQSLTMPVRQTRDDSASSAVQPSPVAQSSAASEETDPREDGNSGAEKVSSLAANSRAGAAGGAADIRAKQQATPHEVPHSAGTAAVPSGSAVTEELEGARQRARKDKGEIERLQALCDQLRRSLEEALADRSKLTEQLSQLEDEVEESKAESARLEAEVQELEAAGAEAARMAEEELQAAQQDYQKLQDRTLAAEARARQHEKEAGAAKREREALEQRVKAMAASLEKRMASVTAELQARQKEVGDLREENESMEKGFTELKALLEESVDERDGLVETLAERDKMLEELRMEVEQFEAEAEVAKREAAESSVALAEAAAEVRTLREAAKGKEQGEDELLQMEASLKAATAAAESAAAEAAEWKAKAELGQKEGKAKSRALAQAEADLALAHQRVLAAEADADEAKRLKAEAEGTSEQLREQTERRAKLFNAAVKAAVSKIQSELESERDEALERITGLEADAGVHAAELQNLQEQVSSLMEELDAATAALAKGEEERQRLVTEVGSLEKEVAAAREQEQEAGKQAERTKAASKALTAKLATLETRCQELQDAVESAKQEAAGQVAEFDAERERSKELLAGVEREKTTLKIAALEAAAKAGEEASALRSRVSELESRLGATEQRAFRVSESARQQLLEGSGMPSKSKLGRQTSALEDLGLEKVREERLIHREKLAQADVESAGESLLDPRRSRQSRKEAPLGWLKRTPLDDHDRVTGRISRRSFILGMYIVLLHLMVMISFTRHSNPCSEALQADRAMALPGL